MKHYIGLIHKEAGSDYGVSVPDFPGCVSAGISLDEVRRFATEALALHIEGMIVDGEVLPEPSTLEAIMADPTHRDSVAILVDAPSTAARSIRISITVPEDALAEMDRYAQAHGLTRSGFLVRSAREIIHSKR